METAGRLVIIWVPDDQDISVETTNLRITKRELEAINDQVYIPYWTLDLLAEGIAMRLDEYNEATGGDDDEDEDEDDDEEEDEDGAPSVIWNEIIVPPPLTNTDPTPW